MVYVIFSTAYASTRSTLVSFGSLALGLISHFMARKQKEPAIIFMVTGIIPLVPGGLAFDATKALSYWSLEKLSIQC